jgi:hypothetical protein
MSVIGCGTGQYPADDGDQKDGPVVSELSRILVGLESAAAAARPVIRRRRLKLLAVLRAVVIHDRRLRRFVRHRRRLPRPALPGRDAVS